MYLLREVILGKDSEFSGGYLLSASSRVSQAPTISEREKFIKCNG